MYCTVHNVIQNMDLDMENSPKLESDAHSL